MIRLKYCDLNITLHKKVELLLWIKLSTKAENASVENELYWSTSVWKPETARKPHLWSRLAYRMAPFRSGCAAVSGLSQFAFAVNLDSPF